MCFDILFLHQGKLSMCVKVRQELTQRDHLFGDGQRPGGSRTFKTTRDVDVWQHLQYFTWDSLEGQEGCTS